MSGRLFFQAGIVVVAALAASCQPRARGAADAPARKIVWPRADEIDPQATRLLPAAARNTVAFAPVPVLVPADASYLYDARVVVEERSYKLRSGTADSRAELMGSTGTETHAGGIEIEVRGSVEPSEYPAGPTANCTVRGLPAVCGVTPPNGLTMRWIERGVAYAVTFYCNAGTSDPRCAADQVLRQAWLMRFVGGSGSGPGQRSR